jgi:hypothetical protein
MNIFAEEVADPADMVFTVNYGLYDSVMLRRGLSRPPCRVRIRPKTMHKDGAIGEPILVNVSPRRNLLSAISAQL